MEYEPRVIQITKELECSFTPDEENAMGHDLAKEEASMAELEERKKKANKGFLSEASVISKNITGLTLKLNNGYEYRPVECEKTINFETGTMTITRRDTKETVEERPLTDEERQLSL